MIKIKKKIPTKTLYKKTMRELITKQSCNLGPYSSCQVLDGVIVSVTGRNALGCY